MNEPRSRGSGRVRRLGPDAIERRFGTRDELLEQAAEVSRAGLRTRQERIVAGARPILHSAVAASLAWLVATEVVGHEQPFFAPISAVITLGLTVGQRRRRAIELAIGVAVGIAIADALVAVIGSGTWQIGVVVALAMTAAALVGGGAIASQAGASAVLVATLQPPEGGFDFDRALDALVGGGVALVVSSAAPAGAPDAARSGEPPSRCRPARRGARSDRHGADHAAARGGGRRPGRRRAGGRGAREPARDARGGRRSGSALAPAARLPERRRPVRRRRRRAGARNRERTRARARRCPRLGPRRRDPGRGGAGRPGAGRARPRRCTAYLDGEDPGPAREAAVRAAALANAVLEATGNLSAVHIVGQIRLVAVDLLRATGLERSGAQEAVRGATLEPE